MSKYFGLEKEDYERIMKTLSEENDKLLNRTKKKGDVKCQCGEMVAYSDCEIVDNDNLVICKDCYKKHQDKRTFEIFRSLEDRIDYDDLDD